MLCGASYLPCVLLARWAVVPFFKAKLPDHEVFTALPTWLVGSIALSGAAWVGARVLSWGADGRRRRERYRYAGRWAFWALWLPFWVWLLVDVASPGEILDDPHLVAILTTNALLALADSVVTPRVEDRFMPVG